LAQRDGYQIVGTRNAKDYAWRGAPGERRAWSSAYADAKAPDNWNDNKNYMRDVARGGQVYDQARMSQDADAEDARIQRRKATRTPTKRTPPRAAGRK
jgi:hypothetical protein